MAGYYLIDTQVVVWLLHDPTPLGPQSRRLLEDPANEVILSYFSLMEIAIKAAIGKMTYDDSIYEDLETMNIRVVNPDRQTLAAYKVHSPDNKDPFDNLLISLSVLNGYQLVTSDGPVQALQVPRLRVINARK